MCPVVNAAVLQLTPTRYVIIVIKVWIQALEQSLCGRLLTIGNCPLSPSLSLSPPVPFSLPSFPPCFILLSPPYRPLYLTFILFSAFFTEWHRMNPLSWSLDISLPRFQNHISIGFVNYKMPTLQHFLIEAQNNQHQ